MPERGYLAATESDITHAVAGRVFGKQQQGGANPLPPSADYVREISQYLILKVLKLDLIIKDAVI